MSCPNATAPIDISLSNITGKCDYKCSYSFQYNNSSCIATNKGDYLKLSYDKSSTPPVVFNTSSYDVEEVRLYTPSLHSFNRSKIDGELIIVHTSNTGAKPLLVCIPIKTNDTTTFSALFFKKIVDTAANNAPSNEESTTVRLQRYNLTLLVPTKPFFSYSATEPYEPCSALVEYIVYAPLNGSLDIMSDTLTKLKSIIQSNSYDIKKRTNLFYNSKGPTIGGAEGGEIYIDCQPVGTSEETVDIITDLGSKILDKDQDKNEDFFDNPLIKFILSAVLFIVILYILNLLINLINPSKSESVVLEGGNFRHS